jgi:hypothetical protein
MEGEIQKGDPPILPMAHDFLRMKEDMVGASSAIARKLPGRDT